MGIIAHCRIKANSELLLLDSKYNILWNVDECDKKDNLNNDARYIRFIIGYVPGVSSPITYAGICAQRSDDLGGHGR
ncbi:hypothetical protein EON65_17630 [archaeon]|nr:MAG: hypothetical protein EON65_17630 [archaeon]